MTARDFSGEQLPAVEQFNTGRKRGCIVRWDFETIKTPVLSNDKRANFRRRKAEERAAKAAKAGKTRPEAQTPSEPQEMRDSGIVAFSEARYIGKPDPERVVADIEYDLAVRYGDRPRPEIDFKYYREAIAALPEA